MRQGQTLSQRHKEARQSSLREYLSNRGKIDYVLDNIEKLECLDEQLDSTEISRLKYAIDSRLKILNKYLPDLASINFDGDINVGGTVELSPAQIKDLSTEDLRRALNGENVIPITAGD